MSLVRGAALTLIFLIMGSVTSFVLWMSFDIAVGYQIILTLAVATVGEHMVSGQGYYYYTKKNGIFVGRVPTWIPLM